MQLNLLENSNSDYLLSVEWDKIIQQLNHYITFEENKDKFHNPILIKTKPEVNSDFDSLQYFIDILITDDGHELKNELGNLKPHKHVSNFLTRTFKSAILELQEINEIVKLFETFNRLYPIIKSWSELHAYTTEKEQTIQINRTLIFPFRKIVSKEGEIDYFNHPELALYYGQVLEIETKIRAFLNQIMDDSNYNSRIQYRRHDIISDRYVIPIRTDSYQSNLGTIVSKSETGMTLYIEPPQVKELSNKRLEYLAKISEIINSLCVEFSKSLTQYHTQLFKSYQCLLRIDEFIAKAEFSLKHNLNRPSIVDDGEIFLYDFFHPLISNPVKNTIKIEKNQKGLVISGPNTGGKTATLKTIVLSQLFIHFGLFVPAKEAHTPLFDSIFYLGRDEQDLSSGLSSFAAEVKAYLQVLDELGTNNLIVIDEIFNSTSSEEASALAISLFERLHSLANVKILISTHHQMLKTFMHANHDFVSAHVGFDIIQHKPNYKLYLGTPGSSMALSIFKNLAKDSPFNLSIVDSATKILEHKMVVYESLLQDVTKRKNELDILLHENEQLKMELLNQKKSQEALLKIKTQEKLEDYEKLLNSTINKAKVLFDQVQLGEITKRKQIENKEHELKREISPEVKERSVDSTSLQYPSEYIVGQFYYSSFLDKNIELKSFNLKKNEATILIGSKTIHTRLDQLFITKQGKSLKKMSGGFVHIERNPDSKHHYDCRGMRLEEFENLMEKAISELVLGEVPFLHVVHGHGTGALKNWLRNYLKAFPQLEYEIPEHSQDGATRINVKTN